MKTFTLSLHIDATLSVDEIWPDGDAPDNPTASDVEDVIDDCGGWSKILDDWNLLDRHQKGTVTDNERWAAEIAQLKLKVTP